MHKEVTSDILPLVAVQNQSEYSRKSLIQNTLGPEGVRITETFEVKQYYLNVKHITFYLKHSKVSMNITILWGFR